MKRSKTRPQKHPSQQIVLILSNHKSSDTEEKGVKKKKMLLLMMTMENMKRNKDSTNPSCRPGAKMLCLALILCCLIPCCDGIKFKIGMLTPWNMTVDFNAYTSASAVSMAIKDIHDDPTLNAGGNIQLSLVTRDSSCDPKIALGNAVDLWNNEHVDVFIGPPCSDSCRVVAELASFYDVPIISWVATDVDMDDKDIYTTLGRTLGPFSKLANFMVDIWKEYGWGRVVVISSNYLLWKDAGVAVRKSVADNNFTLAYEVEFGRDPTDRLINRILTKTKTEGRIVVIICSKEDRRSFMVAAYDLEMTSGDYVFYTVDMLPESEVLNPESVWKRNDADDYKARVAFEAVFHVSLAALSGGVVDAFRVEVARLMQLDPWNVPLKPGTKGNEYAAFLYDAVLLYAVALNETFHKGGDVHSGADVTQNMRKKFFKGKSGNVVLDANGDREPDLWVTDMDDTGTFVRMAELLNTDDGNRVFRRDILPPRWPGGLVGDIYAPKDTPICGFFDELCEDKSLETWVVILIALGACLIGAAVIALVIFLYRRSRFEASLLVQTWRIHYEDVEVIKDFKSIRTSAAFGEGSSGSGSAGGSAGVLTMSGTNRNPISGSSGSGMGRSILSNNQLFCDVGYFRGQLIALKHIQKEHMQVTRSILLEFNEMKDLIHENLCVFVGACITPPNIFLAWHYCSKGSLTDILLNDDMKVDNNFKLSFMSDIAKGMVYLHKSRLHSHGSLKSSNCLVDTRWTVKITDYGLPSFLVGIYQEDEETQYKRKLWTAPEILKENFPPPRGTQKGDVYSFAIVAYEILMRSEPYNFDVMTARDAVNRVRNSESIPFRPILPESTDMGRAMPDMIRKCWAQSPDARPSFSSLYSSVRKMAGGRIDIMSNVMRMMEKYAFNLEEIVDERTQQLVEEKKKTDKLLSRLLPSSVAEQLKAGRVVSPENYDEATIYFSDIVGFTTLASESTPMQIVDFLNDLYLCFDDIINTHDVYKVETIGDAYMVVSGVPVRNGARHVAEIANVSLDLLSAVTHFKIKHRPNHRLQLRIGLHCGPVVTGVVGLIMPRYCLFGDTVNMAARMESTGKALHIHVSKQYHIALSELGKYEMTLRGEMNVKGKGMQMTYWLHGKAGFKKTLPAFKKLVTDD